jgi:hypothetical protein
LNAIEKLPGKQVLNSAKLIPEMVRMNWLQGFVALTVQLPQQLWKNGRNSGLFSEQLSTG